MAVAGGEFGPPLLTRDPEIRAFRYTKFCSASDHGVRAAVGQPAVAGAVTVAGGGPKRFSPASPCWRKKTSSTIRPISGIRPMRIHQPVRFMS
jgi:hypothetical protein